MNIAAIANSTQSRQAAETADTTPKPNQTLGVDDFLKLITVQLQNQDPLKPMDDTAFISQMASFTSLQQTKVLTSDFETYSGQQTLVAANSLLGHYVSVFDPTVGSVTGKVDSVSVDHGVPRIMVNGVAYDLDTVKKVTSEAPVTVPVTTP